MDMEILTRQITHDVTKLPIEKVLEVADFVQFLKKKNEERLTPLAKTGLTVKEAEKLRWHLSSFENDWDAPGMEAYDEL